MKYPHLAARIFNTPLLIHPQKLDAIIAGLGERLAGAPLQLDAIGQPAVPTMFTTRKGERSDRGYRVVDGVAVLGIGGALVHRTRMEADSTVLLGYNDVAADLEEAMHHPDIHAVLQVYDSPGGEVAGAFEYAQRAFALRGKKPMLAIADSMAASAAYLGASAADELVLTTTGYAGSIGVVMRHVDLSQALALEGVAVTHIFAGARKVDGNAFEPLPEAVRVQLQGEMNDLYDEFINAVALQRKMAPDEVRKTQAAMYRGVAAIACGLADRISTTDQLITELAAQRVRSYSAGPSARSTANDNHKGNTMSGNTTPGGPTPANSAPAAASFTQADVDGGRAQGAAAERARVGAILTHQGAATNMALAIQCVNTGLSAEQANGILGVAPVAAASQGNPFAAAMAHVGNPKVSGVEGKPDAQDDPATLAGSWNRAFGIKA
ncbi:S49 family peptidase [Polaromonas sp. CG_23.6]|uniref:S49 family peptidase n=1 Tax=Polaromonas sp. CG_23.6 TaxID=2760709 RepID=UPI0024756546|nr:S49 family peptidase [Polaromonas sp. CG_23.6]MDH6185304.1 signal peptide peptidase SppA [Polaromonas sp. CG_23.6]